MIMQRRRNEDKYRAPLRPPRERERDYIAVSLLRMKSANSHVNPRDLTLRRGLPYSFPHLARESRRE